MTPQPEPRPVLKRLARDERGALAVVSILCLPLFLGFLALTVDMAYGYWTRNMLQVTAEAAALAATAKLFPDPTQAAPHAQLYAGKNMPSVLADADVLGCMWSDITKTCPGEIPVANCTVATCNAVKVTTKKAAGIFFAPALGVTGFTVSASAIATYGSGSGTAIPPWNVSIVQDISGSFEEELDSGKAADQALLDCMFKYAPDGSKLGIDVFAGKDNLLRSPLDVKATTATDTTSTTTAYTKTTNRWGQTTTTATTTTTTTTTTDSYQTLTNDINSIAACGGTPMPECTVGSSRRQTNIGGAINNTTAALCSGGTCPAGSQPAMVIVTDGQANTCGSSCPNGTTPQQYAEAAATAAGAKGIDVFTIYYGNNNDDATWLAKLVKGNGLALKAPTADQIKTQMQKLCTSSMPHRLVW